MKKLWLPGLISISLHVLGFILLSVAWDVDKEVTSKPVYETIEITFYQEEITKDVPRELSMPPGRESQLPVPDPEPPVRVSQRAPEPQQPIHGSDNERNVSKSGLDTRMDMNSRNMNSAQFLMTYQGMIMAHLRAHWRERTLETVAELVQENLWRYNPHQLEFEF
jgi:hypothetical protein